MPVKIPAVLSEDFTNLVEKLSNASGVSGAEGSVRAIIKDKLDALEIEHKTDALGNVLVEYCCGKPGALRIMIAAHMDEVGMMVVEEDEGGLYKFVIVGGIDLRILPGKSVWVGKQRLPGVIGARPIHLTESEDRKNPIQIENLRIDLGPGGAGKVKPGDRAVFATDFYSNDFSYSGKALDDRLGIAILLTILSNPPKNIDLLLAFTTQEEIGLRGARVAGYALKPDAAIAIDATPANDLPSWNEEENIGYNTRLGHGPAIYIADGYTLSDPRLVNLLQHTAQKENIPYQIRQPGGGGTDAGSIHKQREGIPSISLSIPIRYAHTPCSIAWQSDIAHTLLLIQTTLKQFPADLFTGLR